MDSRAAQREPRGFVYQGRGGGGLATATAAVGGRRSSQGFLPTGRPGHNTNQDRQRPNSPSGASQVIAHALATFQHQDDIHSSDCAFDARDPIDILEIRDHNWWRGVNARTGREGLLPSSCVKITKGAVGMGVLARVRAVYDFKPQQKGDLGFLAGQTLLVTELTENDWWKGKLDGSNGPEGKFPRNYVVIQERSLASGSAVPSSLIPTLEMYGYITYTGSLHLGLPFKKGDNLIIYIKLSGSLSWGINTESNYQGVFPHAYARTNTEPSKAGPIKACAIVSYPGTICADLSFKKGDLIQVKHLLGSEIIWGRNTLSGMEGLCPDVLLWQTNPLGKVAPSPTVSQEDEPLCGTALYTWLGESEGDLPMNKNDRISLIGDYLDDWCKGRNKRTGVTGIFPTTYVRFPKTAGSQVLQKAPEPTKTVVVGQSKPVSIAVTPPKEQPQSPLSKPGGKSVSGSRLDTDLVRDSKLDTLFTKDDEVCHTSYTFHPRNRYERIVLEEKWKIQKYLGRGGFGQVDLQECVQGQKKGELRAVKKIIKNPYEDEDKKINYDRELEAIAKFSHEKYVHCFVRSFGWYENEEAIFISLEYFQHGDLQKHMRGRFPEFEVGNITSQLLEGLSYMHDNGFAHRDLKPANILVKERSPNWWVKIGDFGISKRAGGDDTALRTVVGSPRCIAPEVMGIFSLDSTEDIDSDNMVYTVAVDQWALGAIAFQLLTSRDPFPQPRSLHNYINGKEPFPSDILQESRVSPQCIELLKALLAPMPSHRPNASLALRHPWLEEINLSPLPLKQSDSLEAEFSLLQFDTTAASLSWTEALEQS